MVKHWHIRARAAGARADWSRAVTVTAALGVAGLTSMTLATLADIQPVAAAGNTSGTLYFSLKAGTERVRSIVYTYDGTTFSLGTANNVAATPGADGLAFTPAGKLLVAGQANALYEVNASTHTFNTVTAGGAKAFYLAIDPGGKVAWTGGSPNGHPGGLASVPVDPAANGTQQPINGADTALESLVFNPATPSFAFYTATTTSAPNFAVFGCMDLTTFKTFRLLADPVAHGVAFDTFSHSLLLFGTNKIAQLAPPATCNAQTSVSIAHTLTAAGSGHHFDDGIADGRGHVFVTDDVSGNLYFLDYQSGNIASPTFQSTVFLQTDLDHVTLPNPPPITTVAVPTSVLAGSPIHDTAHVGQSIEGAVPTGTVDFSLYAPADSACATPIFTSSGNPLNGTGDATSSTYIPTLAGQFYHWKAHYSGDATYPPSDSACAEPVSVLPAGAVQGPSSIATVSSTGGVVGTAIHDAATVSGSNPTGTVTFRLFSPSDPSCAGAPVFTSGPVTLTGGHATSASYVTTLAGTYHWEASYSGDEANAPATSACSTEPVDITAIGGAQGITAPNTGVASHLRNGLGLLLGGEALVCLALTAGWRRRRSL